MAELVTVIIPAYNSEKTIQDAILSALSQTWEDIEVIVVDDGSTDDTLTLCRAIAAENEKVRIIHSKEEGVSAARNRGITAANGEFITFLDADDALEPDMVAVLMDILANTGADIAGCGFASVQAGEKPKAARKPKNHAEEIGELSVFMGDEIISGAVLEKDTRIWSKLFTRKAIGRVRFREDFSIGEDFLFMMDVTAAGNEGAPLIYVRTARKLYRYLINPKGAMERPFTKTHMDQVRCWETAGEIIDEHFPLLAAGRDTKAKLASIQIIYAVLTAGKILMLPDELQALYQEEFNLLHSKLLEYRKVPGSFMKLPEDYKMRSVMLAIFPSNYRRMYRKIRAHKQKIKQ